MRDAVANLVYPVLMHGLRLHERLERGEQPDLDQEQATLKGLLGAEAGRTRLWADSGGEMMAVSESVSRPLGGGMQLPAFRYGLVCWLDELFTVESRWKSEWTERKLEEALYGSNDRAWKFWDQARRAEARPGTDDLEVFFLCVMLGFRGDYRDQPDKLRAWRDAVEGRVTRGAGQEWPAPPEREPPGSVPPLRGRERLQRMILVAAAVLLVLVPAATFYLVYQLH
jgi:type VI secretion system protein ImpK